MVEKFEIVEVFYDIKLGKVVEKSGLIIGKTNRETEGLYAVYIIDFEEVIYLNSQQFRRTGRFDLGTVLFSKDVG